MKATTTNIENMGTRPERVMVNGISIRMDVYRGAKKLLRKASETDAKPERVSTRGMKQVSDPCERFLHIDKQMEQLRCFDAIYRNGTRQWGGAWTEIMDTHNLRGKFVLYCRQWDKVEAKRAEIAKYMKRDSDEVWEVIREYGWLLDDTKEVLYKLQEALIKSKVLMKYEGREVIEGCAKRIGLRGIMGRLRTTLVALDGVPRVLYKIADTKGMCAGVA